MLKDLRTDFESVPVSLSLRVTRSSLLFAHARHLEGHSLSKNPWHGKIKVREELKWLEKYGDVPASGH
jgi:hypothetical protein